MIWSTESENEYNELQSNKAVTGGISYLADNITHNHTIGWRTGLSRKQNIKYRVVSDYFLNFPFLSFSFINVLVQRYFTNRGRTSIELYIGIISMAFTAERIQWKESFGF
jgi:hypothetical protein